MLAHVLVLLPLMTFWSKIANRTQAKAKRTSNPRKIKIMSTLRLRLQLRWSHKPIVFKM